MTAERAITKEGTITALNAKRDQIACRLNDLHREMMLQPVEERRANWDQYYRRLAELMRLQDDVTEAMTATLGLGTSGQNRMPSVSTLANTAQTRRPGDAEGRPVSSSRR